MNTKIISRLRHYCSSWKMLNDNNSDYEVRIKSNNNMYNLMNEECMILSDTMVEPGIISGVVGYDEGFQFSIGNQKFKINTEMEHFYYHSVYVLKVYEYDGIVTILYQKGVDLLFGSINGTIEKVLDF